MSKTNLQQLIEELELSLPDERGTISRLRQLEIDSPTGSGGGSVFQVTSNDGSVAVTNPTGPTVDLSVSALGSSSASLSASASIGAPTVSVANVSSLSDEQIIGIEGA